MNPQKPKTKSKNRESTDVQREIYRMNCLIGCRNSGRVWLMKELQKSFGEYLMQRSADTSSSSHEPPMEPRAYVEPRFV